MPYTESNALIATDITNECQKDVSTIKSRTSKRSMWSGWQKGVAVSCVCNIVALILSITLLIWASSKPMTSYGTYIIWQGPEHSGQVADVLSHLGINIVSAAILAGSNYTLQVLIAPTRTEIDRAHHEKRSLDVGISSFHNWYYMSWQRKLLYGSLFFLTLPAHLLYNSIIFSTEASYPLGGAIVTKDFLQIPPSDASYNEIWSSAQSDQWVKATANGCLDEVYSRGKYSMVLFFTNFTSFPQNSSAYYYLNDTNRYVLSDQDNTTLQLNGSWLFPLDDIHLYVFMGGLLALVPCTAPNACHLSNSTNFSANCDAQTIDMTSIEYCLAKTAPFVTIELIPQLPIIVIICSVLTAALSSMVLLRSNPLVTIGDAIASFLDFPDVFTKNMGPLSVMQLPSQTLVWKSRSELPPPSAQDTIWKIRNRYFFSAVTPLRWCLTISLALIYGATAVLLLYYLEQGTARSPPSDWPLEGSIILANTPQLMVSSIYLCYNGLFTCMSSSAEWMSFCKHKKGLRVSKPKPESEQRRTYFLALPYKYSLPLAIKSMVLHWFLSGSLSLNWVRGYNSDGTPNHSSDFLFIGISSTGTPIFLVTSAALAGALVLIPIGLGFRRYNASMPLARNNSMIISAACHPIKTNDGSMSTEKLQYGVISEHPSGGYHVGFSNKEVLPLVPGEFYK